MPTIEGLRARISGAAEYCQAELWPLVDAFEKENTVDLSALKKSAMKAGPVAFVGGLLHLLLPTKTVVVPALKLVGFAGTLALFAGLFLIGRELTKVFGLAEKRFAAMRVLTAQIKLKAISYLEPTFKFSAETEFPMKLYSACGLFPSGYDRASAEDRLVGRIGETNFDLVEIRTYNVKTTRDSNGRMTKQSIPIFIGLMLTADFNKNFDGHTIIETDGAEKSFGFLARGAQRLMSSVSTLKLVELENPEFEAHFKVRSTDANAARYILTPSFMERIVEIKKKMGVHLQLSFQDGEVVVAIPHPADFLEFKSGLEDLTKSVDGLLNELVDLLTIIESLELNMRIWNKSSRAEGA